MTISKTLGRITDFDIMVEDHGIMTFSLGVDLEGGNGWGLGGYALDGYDEKLGRRVGSAFGCDVILRLMQIFKLKNLNDIKGKMCYVLSDNGNTAGSTAGGLQAIALDGGEGFMLDDLIKHHKEGKHLREEIKNV